MPKLRDITGEKYGLLTAITIAGRTKRGDVKWLCKCECGNEICVIGYNLRNGHTKSCGCFRADASKWANITHGQASTEDNRTAEYRAWTNMKSRCFNPKLARYKDYGGRGITVCKEWVESFERFYSDMGPKPTPKHSIDRIDVDGNYEISNCRWATASVQNKNKRRG